MIKKFISSDKSVNSFINLIKCEKIKSVFFNQDSSYIDLSKQIYFSNRSLEVLKDISYDFEGEIIGKIINIDSDESRFLKRIFHESSMYLTPPTNMVKNKTNNGIRDVIIDNDFLKLFEILYNQKIKNNILLVGPPGVGKTTFIKYFLELKNQKVDEIIMSNLISDTKYRGEFEKKLKEKLEIALENKTDIFIDEFHTLINAGNSEGGISGANILKPFVTSPDIKILGATTIDEFNILKKDPALLRRFNVISINEPSSTVLLKIGKSIGDLYSLKLKQDDILEVINILKKRKGSYFPDKLIDYLDFTLSYHKVNDSQKIKLISTYNIWDNLKSLELKE